MFYLEHTFGAWVVLVIGLVLASLTFIYEYFSGKKGPRMLKKGKLHKVIQQFE